MNTDPRLYALLALCVAFAIAAPGFVVWLFVPHLNAWRYRRRLKRDIQQREIKRQQRLAAPGGSPATAIEVSFQDMRRALLSVFPLESVREIMRGATNDCRVGDPFAFDWESITNAPYGLIETVSAKHSASNRPELYWYTPQLEWLVVRFPERVSFLRDSLWDEVKHEESELVRAVFRDHERTRGGVLRA